MKPTASFQEVFKEFIKPLLDENSSGITIDMKQKKYIITAVNERTIEFKKSSGKSEHTLSIATLKKMFDTGKNEIILGGLQPYYNPLIKKLLELKQETVIEIEKRSNYVIVIDEINRANISRVFGELITLIEPDKRSHGAIPMSCTLPSGDKFEVPSNLHIIGTMNTADKSIALLDVALRRRFEFEAMYPDYSVAGLQNKDILQKINNQIIEKKSHDFQIGHSYFMGENDLADNMNKKVVPLLMEYFMNDQSEVALILKDAGLNVDENLWPIKVVEKND